MKLIRILIPALCGLAACDPVPQVDPTEAFKGLVINEVAAHENSDGFDTWVEILNTTDKSIALDGLSFFITDSYFKGQKIGDLSGSLAAGERKVISSSDRGLKTGISSVDPFTLVLGPDAQNAVDSFERTEDTKPLGAFASYQRIPDGSGELRKLTYSSPGRENVVFDLSKTRPTAVWAWGSHLSDLVSDNGAKMREMKDKGYDHILMNYAGFHNKNYRQQAIKFIQIADEIGLAVHVWLQCFYDGGWVSPIDDDKKAYKEEVFERRFRRGPRHFRGPDARAQFQRRLRPEARRDGEIHPHPYAYDLSLRLLQLQRQVVQGAFRLLRRAGEDRRRSVLVRHPDLRRGDPRHDCRSNAQGHRPDGRNQGLGNRALPLPARHFPGHQRLMELTYI